MIKKIIYSFWFRAAAIAVVSLLLLLEKKVFYSGIGLGIALRELAFGFKKDTPKKEEPKKKSSKSKVKKEAKK